MDAPAPPPPPAPSSRRRRMLLTLPLVAAALGLWYFVGRGGATQVPVHYIVGDDAPTLRQLDLRWRRSDGADRVHLVTLRFTAASPAPTDLYRHEHLGPGTFEVEAQLRHDADRPPRLVTRQVTVAGSDQPVEVDLRAPR
jgi:hypothetical protein